MKERQLRTYAFNIVQKRYRKVRVTAHTLEEARDIINSNGWEFYGKCLVNSNSPEIIQELYCLPIVEPNRGDLMEMEDEDSDE